MPLAHTRLLVINFPECYRFYRDILQLRPSWGDEADSYASFTQGGDGKIVLAVFGRPAMSEVVGTAHLPLDPPAQDRSLLIFQVEDLDATVKRLAQQDVRFVLEPTDFRIGASAALICGTLMESHRNSAAHSRLPTVLTGCGKRMRSGKPGTGDAKEPRLPKKRY